MNKKTQLIISIIGITIIILTLIGYTYGYYLSILNENEEKKSVEVKTGASSVSYVELAGDESEIIMKPGTTVTKLFKVENTGSIDAAYSIILVDVVNNFDKKELVRYNLYRIGNTETFPDNYVGCVEDVTDQMSCKLVVKDAEYPTVVSVIKENEIIEQPSSYYTYAMVITYINHPTINQDLDQGNTISGKINIRAAGSEEDLYIEGLLKDKIMDSATLALETNDDTRTLYNDTFNLNSITNTSSNTERMLALTEDDYGTSFVYRGNVIDNYVSFAGLIWRVVRINGDGSVRLILDESLDKVKKDGVAINSNNKLLAIDSDGIVTINTVYDDNAYVGYMYGDFTTNSATYDEAHSNFKSSIVKTYIDTFYEEYLLSYQDYFADTLFCGDKTLADSSIGTTSTSQNKRTGFGTGADNKTYYAGMQRLYYSTGTTLITTATPTLECAKDADNTYSRYTSIIDENISTNKNVLVNNDLTYPIGLLSADEFVMTGAWGAETNTSASNWWTMSPSSFTGTRARSMVVNTSGKKLSDDYVYYSGGVRPVINLRAETLINSGIGTSLDPYVVKEN